MRKQIVLLFLAIFVAFLMIVGYLFMPQNLTSLDNKIRDQLFIFRGAIPTTGEVVIVDIDEKSLAALGQWPWERDKVARLLDNLKDAGVGIIGLDVVFAEPDNSSPARVLKQIGIDNIDAPDYDQILGRSIAEAPVIAGYVFLMEKDEIVSDKAPQIPAIFVEKGSGDRDFLLNPYRAQLNIPSIQDSAYSSGYFNTIPDDDSGIIRSVPLIMRYNDLIYPSLSLEMIRNAVGVTRVMVVEDPEIGVEKIVIGDLEIPTDRFGRLFVNYRGAGKTFKYISAIDIYNNNFDPELLNGKFVLLGTSAAGLLDLRAMPYDNVYPGVEIHANVIDNIIAGDLITKPSWIQAVDLLTIFFITVVLTTILASSSAIVSLIVFILFNAAVVYGGYHMLFTHGLVINLLFPLFSILIVTIISLVTNYFLESKQKELIRAKLARKVSPSVVDDLLKNPDLAILDGKERNVTIFFSDIRGFTSLSESMRSPSELIKLLNSYMTPMTDIIMKTGGTVDKFIGDAIMAYWNAPSDIKNHEDAAVAASLNQLAALTDLNKTLTIEGKPNIAIGIGLNTGLATVGEMGSKGRADYTVIGDPVNLASRVEGLNKVYASRILITEYTKNGLKRPYVIREVDKVRVKGKEEPVAIFEVLDFGEPTSELKEELDLYQNALTSYRKSDFTEALKIFKQLQDKSGQHLYALYIDRCEHLINNPPENFDGVFTFTTK